MIAPKPPLKTIFKGTVMTFRRMKRIAAAAALPLVIGTVTMAVAQLPTKSSMNAQEQANLMLVLDWWREVIQARHVELIDKYAWPDMIQHNPNFPQGTAALKERFGATKPVNPIPATLATPPKLALSQGDIVILVWGHTAPDPADRSTTYEYDSFDAFRIERGRIKEHWDAAQKTAPASAPANR
jgi:predicted SnoaL-like aldol condensation-catalyzing enzyme